MKVLILECTSERWAVDGESQALTLAEYVFSGCYEDVRSCLTPPNVARVPVQNLSLGLRWSGETSGVANSTGHRLTRLLDGGIVQVWCLYGGPKL